MSLLSLAGMQRLVRDVPGWTGLVAAALGTVAVLVRLLSWSWLGSPSPVATMQPNVAICFIASGIALRRLGGNRHDPVGRLLGGIPLAAGILTLIEYGAGVEQGFGHLFSPQAVRTTVVAGRMALDAAVCFLLLGLAVVLVPGAMPDVWLSVLTASSAGIAAIAIVGYAYSGMSLYRLASSPEMALSTAAGMVMLSGGVAALRPRAGLLGICLSDGTGGQLSRTLLPILMLGPVVLGWVRLQGQQAGHYGTEVGVAILAISTATIFTGIMLLYATRLNEADRARAAAEGTARELGDFSRQIVECVQEGIVVIDRELRYVVQNPYVTALTRRPASSVVGRRMRDVLGPLAEEPLQWVERALSGETIRNEVHQLLATGDRVWLSRAFSPLRDLDGRITGVIITVHNISERMRVETELRDARQRMATALAAAQVGVWQVDVETRQVTWTENLAALFGQPTEVFAAESGDWMRYVSADDRSSVQAAVDRALAERTGFSVEFRVVMDDGRTRWLHSTARLGGGERASLIGVTLDITEQRALEAQFRQAQKMEAIGQLAGGIAHDFNNLLTAILGYARLVQEQVTTASGTAEVDEIIKAGDRATALTRQLLTFSRQKVVETRIVDLDEIVQGLVPMLERLIGAEIRLETLLSSAGRIRADRTQIEQVLLNLVVNARDAMPSGGRIRIQTASVHFDPAAIPLAGLNAGEHVMLAVSDNGVGMTDAVRQRIFEPFFTTKEPGKGTGLGLSLVYGVVKQSRGAVDVYSEPGAGTSFKIYWPRVTSEAADGHASAATRQPAIDASGITVLVVEDESAVRVLTRIILERAGFRVFVAENPAVAERLHQDLAPLGLLITDIIMPGGRGTELFARLIARQPSLRVLYMSGYSDDASLDVSLRAPGMGFMEKPFSAETLLNKVREVLDV